MRKRSSGARPKKAVRAEVLALKAQLATLRSHEWVKAQMIFDQMTGLCGVEGPMGGRMVPRACRFCDHYGHTRQHCAAKKKRDEKLTAREIEMDKAAEYVRPQSAEECGDHQDWEEIKRFRAALKAAHPHVEW